MFALYFTSNHTLECIKIPCLVLSTLAEECLVLNENGNKMKVIRDKILRFYFVGDFDVSQFSNLALSVLPDVVSQIEGKEKLSAMYRFLQHIPELCNVSGRVSSEEQGNKRQKRS